MGVYERLDVGCKLMFDLFCFECLETRHHLWIESQAEDGLEQTVACCAIGTAIEVARSLCCYEVSFDTPVRPGVDRPELPQFSSECL